MFVGIGRISGLLKEGSGKMTLQSVRNMTVQHGKEFIKKNTELKRPISPHLSIYKFELPPLLSGSHRTTGFIFTSISLGVALFSFLPWDWKTILSTIYDIVPYPLIVFAKFGASAGVLYHVFNGMRHLTWDLGYGFRMKTLYKSGYFVVLAAIISGALITAYCTLNTVPPSYYYESK